VKLKKKNMGSFKKRFQTRERKMNENVESIINIVE
jgi:hypothetical protein